MFYNQSPPLFYGEYNTTIREWVPNHGLDVSFLNTLGNYFNFKWRIDHCNDNWGHPYPNGSWDGLIGKVAVKVIKILPILLRSQKILTCFLNSIK